MSIDHNMAPVPVDATWTVNDLLARYPRTITALNAFGIDSCCGGAATLAEAAADARVQIGVLLELVADAAAAEAR